MDPELERLLRLGSAAVGCIPDERIIAGLSRYLRLLVLWNRRVNLTSVHDPAGIIERHFVDSLAVVPHLPTGATTLVDVGSGAGFPGAVIALARPALAVTLVESIHKKAAFLEALRRELPLPNVTVRAQRVENMDLRADVAISRATWELTAWLERGTALIQPGGTVIGMEGAEQPPLPPGATRHPYPLGKSTRAIVLFHVEQEPALH